VSAPSGAPFNAFLRSFAIAAALTLAAGAAVTVFVDPLWIFRTHPPWLSWTGGVNRLLDVDMRRAKPLQLFSRPAETVLIGSSTVYRGLRPADVAGGPAYNLGLSSLMADELPALANLAAARGASRIVIGLDYYMFTAFPGPPRLAGELDRPAERLAARFRAALSLRDLAGSLPSVLASAYEPGAWRFDGFKETPDYPAAVTRRIAAEQNFAAMAYRPETLGFLAEALGRLRGRELRLYLSPMSAPELALAAAAGRAPEIARWRADVAQTARAFGIEAVDLTEAHPFDDFDPKRGSSRFWLDTLHYKPEVGRWILERVGA
jgi:hypothetical protein